MVNPHMHQCPGCKHTWTCELNDCGGKLNVYDGRCFRRVSSQATMRYLRPNGLYTGGNGRKYRVRSRRMVG